MRPTAPLPCSRALIPTTRCRGGRSSPSVLVVGCTYVGYQVAKDLARIFTWAVVAGFFAIVLNPAVDLLQRRFNMKLGVATRAGVRHRPAAHRRDALRVHPADRRPGERFSSTASRSWSTTPSTTAAGRRHLVGKYNIDKWVHDNRARLQSSLSSAGQPAVNVVKSVFTTILAFVTILVLTILMTMRGPASPTAL